jgi:hypothetical protein
MILALIAAAHVYVLPWKMLFMLPAESEKPCGITSLRYGPPDGKWELGSNPPAADCQFRVLVQPGNLLPAWSDLPGKPADALDLVYTAQGAAKPAVVTAVKPETIEPKAAASGDFSAKASKVKNSVRVELTNKSDKPVLVGDAVANRGVPKDDCVGTGAEAVLQPNETLVDQRPGLLSPSMKVFVAVFTGEKSCKWVEVTRK